MDKALLATGPLRDAGVATLRRMTFAPALDSLVRLFNSHEQQDISRRPPCTPRRRRKEHAHRLRPHRSCVRPPRPQNVRRPSRRPSSPDAHQLPDPLVPTLRTALRITSSRHPHQRGPRHCRRATQPLTRSQFSPSFTGPGYRFDSERLLAKITVHCGKRLRVLSRSTASPT